MSQKQTPARRVGMVLETPFPNDARVEREALALIESGYEVHLLCGQGKERQAETEIYQGIHVHRVDPRSVRAELGMPVFRIRTRFPYSGVYRNVVKHLTGTETDWQALIQRFIQEQQPDILHVHDLRLLKTALSVSRRNPKIKLVADLHENYPALVGRLTTQRKGEAKGRQTRQFWQKAEQKNLPCADKVIVVVEEARERLLAQATLNPEDVHIVRNVVDAEKFLSASPTPLTAEERQKLDGRFVLCYVGHINASHRGIETVLKALPILKQTIPNVLFLGVGSIREAYFEENLKPLIDTLNLHDLVYFTGYRSETDFIPYIQQSHVGLCPHVKTELIESTFPNKVFLYNLFEKPVVVNSCKPLVRYANETNSSLVFHDDNPEDLARQVIQLYQQPELAKELGHNGRQSVLNRYSWEHEKKILSGLYADLG